MSSLSTLRYRKLDEYGGWVNSKETVLPFISMATGRELGARAAAFDIVSDAIIIRSLDGRILDCNRAAESTFGWKRDEALGQSVFQLLRPELPCSPVEIESELHRESTWSGKTLLHSRDGRQIICHSRWSLSPLEDGRSCIIEIDREISPPIASTAGEGNRTEEKLKLALLDLARATRDLEQFASIASHDLQEPLRMVTSFLELLNRRFGERLDDEAKRYIDFAIGGAHRMRDLVISLLNYSRIGTRKAPFSPVNMNEAVTKARQDLRSSIEESKAEVVSDPLPTVEGNLPLLTQLIENLLSNAIKFRRDGAPRIHISAVSAANFWRFEIRDNGIGLPMSEAVRIFEVFKRLHSQDAYPGTGLGLALCAKIVERHGGSIWVESSHLGTGSTFCFTLPQ